MRALPLLLCLALPGCERAPSRPVSSDGMRHANVAAPPAGAVARGAAAERALLRAPPVAVSRIAGARGYTDFCAPCHGSRGAGDGAVIAHGFTRPLPLSGVDRSPARVAAIITSGYRSMLPMAGQIAPAERWAIAGHVATLGR